MTVSVWPQVMVTGHRPQALPPPAHGWIRGELHRIAAKLRITHGTTLGHTGMALGADMWWADSLYRAGIPFPQQPDPWRKYNPEAVAEWQQLRALAAAEHVYGSLAGLAGDARKRCAVVLLHDRNDGMLDAADAVVAVWIPARRSGGTYSALVKAHQRGMPVIHVNPAARTVTMPSPARWDELLHPDRPTALPLPRANRPSGPLVAATSPENRALVVQGTPQTAQRLQGATPFDSPLGEPKGCHLPQSPAQTD